MFCGLDWNLRSLKTSEPKDNCEKSLQVYYVSLRKETW